MGEDIPEKILKYKKYLEKYEGRDMDGKKVVGLRSFYAKVYGASIN